MTLRTVKGSLIALPLLGTGLCVQAAWSEARRATRERSDPLTARIFTTAAVLDGANAIVGLGECAIVWKHHIATEGQHKVH